MADASIHHLNVVTIGGGTGSFTLLSRFKEYFTGLTAVVNMADDGGSTGLLRDELGVLPPGDVRQCLVALSDAPELRALFNYRFSEGSLKGQSFGNLFLSAAEKVGQDFETAVELASHVLRIHGKVVPVTTDRSELVLHWGAETIRGEYRIGNLDFGDRTRPKLSLEPTAHLSRAAQDAILAADYVVIAPGNLYGSLAPALIVDGMAEVLDSTEATVLYACNLVTKPGQTDGFKVHDYAAEIERFVGRPVLDYVLYNTDRPDQAVLDKYIHAGELLVEADPRKLSVASYEAIGLPLIAHDFVSPDRKGDAIAASRTLIRHDAATLATAIQQLHA
ncbi:MAG TPA: gluconeogenesis factor YvcK family protein [Candidatus Saccharimonadales bacterium]|nr:gluconeogenesis factor YvcK family protein [Candidatus Saccharimonadales bacterium]